LKAVIYNAKGETDETSITMHVFDAETYNSVPWIENFQLEKRAMTDEGPSSWTCERMNGQLSVIDNELRLYDNGTEGVFKTGEIDISKGPVAISMDINSEGDLGQDDYASFYKIVDGGVEELIKEIKGPVNETFKITGEAEGKTLQIVIRSDVNASTRYYYFDNLSVDYK
jgi:hypothetical protein